MGQLKGGPNGYIVGKVGKLVGKVRDGKPYLAAAPKSYKMSMLPHEVDKRNIFTINAKVAPVIKADKIIFRAWQEADVKANNVHNKINSINYHHCEARNPSTCLQITPPNGFILEVLKVEQYKDKLEAFVIPFQTMEEENINFMMYICFHHPVKRKKEYFVLKRIENFEQDGFLLSAKYSDDEKKLAGTYRNKYFYLCAVTTDSKGKIIRHSKTAGIALNSKKNDFKIPKKK